MTGPARPTPRVYVAVVGPAEADEHVATIAEAVGELLGDAGAVTITGGLGGVMAAASRGARTTGGTTVGILPSRDRTTANPWVDVAVPTGLGEGRNALVVAAADAVIAVGGSWGTLAEVALALRAGTTVVGIGTWQIRDAAGRELPESPMSVETPAAAVAAALAAASAAQHSQRR